MKIISIGLPLTTLLANHAMATTCGDQIRQKMKGKPSHLIIREIHKNCAAHILKGKKFEQLFNLCKSFEIKKLKTINAESVKKVNLSCDTFAQKMKKLDSRKTDSTKKCFARNCDNENLCAPTFREVRVAPLPECSGILAKNECMHSNLESQFPKIIQWKASDAGAEKTGFVDCSI